LRRRPFARWLPPPEAFRDRLRNRARPSRRTRHPDRAPLAPLPPAAQPVGVVPTPFSYVAPLAIFTLPRPAPSAKAFAMTSRSTAFVGPTMKEASRTPATAP